MKYTITVCDVCQKEIGFDDFRYIFHNWHCRIGKCTKFHMCEDCFEKFKEWVNISEQK